MAAFCEKPLDISDIERGVAFMDTCWLFGLRPGNSKLTVPNNCVAFAKALVCGEIHVAAIDIETVYKAANHDLQKPGYDGLDKLLNSIEAWTAETMDEFRTAGVTMKQRTLHQNEVLFVPMGWLIMEKVSSASSLVYGVRKSWMTATDSSKKGYTILRDYFNADGRNVARMNQILAKM